MDTNLGTRAARDAAVLVALDWGTSSVRAYLMAADGGVLQQRGSAHGIQNLPLPGVAGFERALIDLCGDWLRAAPGVAVAAGGMVGSAQGWRQAPYVACPADVHELARHAVTIDSAAGVRILIAPGVMYDPPGAPPDVIRGEEIQIAGALLDDPSWSQRCRMVLPGTHSKWVRVAQDRIEGFSTYMTGEMFAVLCHHSILGRLMPDPGATGADEPDPDAADAAFAAGLSAAAASRPGDLTHQLFAVRTLGLTGRTPAPVLRDHLSGLLIGHEIVSGLAHMTGDEGDGAPLLLIGEPKLCRRYAQAFDLFGVRVAALLDNTAPRGLFRFAAAAGLIAPVQETADDRR